MGRLLVQLSVICILLGVSGGEALAEYYRYTDDKGTLHVTDSLYKVPDQYQDQVKTTKEDCRTDGMTPGLGHAITAQKFLKDAWYDYGSMPFYEKWYLLALAGTRDPGIVLESMKMWIFLGTFLLLLGVLYTFQVIDRRATRVLVLFTITVILGTAMFYKYVKAVEFNSNVLLHKVKEMQNVKKERQRKMMAILNSTDGGH